MNYTFLKIDLATRLMNYKGLAFEDLSVEKGLNKISQIEISLLNRQLVPS
jgi:hypothetical protein